MSKYPHGEVIPLHWDDEEVSFIAIKGDVPDTDAIAKVEPYGHSPDEIRLVERCFMRWVPDRIEGVTRLADATKGHGAFVVTKVYLKNHE